MDSILRLPLEVFYPYPVTDQESSVLHSLKSDFSARCEEMVYESHVRPNDLLLTSPERSMISEMLEFQNEILALLNRTWNLSPN
ncbi:MAG: hypothetical protein H6581_09235 [Bacteroidia bacterium]|nr:hypothetical protein [Bacteroidia bacterium]